MHNYLEIIAYWQQQNIDSIPKLEQALDNLISCLLIIRE